MRRRTGTGTGRRRSAEAWRALVEGCGASGLSLEQYCAREGIGIASYHRWRRLLSQRVPAERAQGTMPARAVSRRSTPAFVDLGALSSAGRGTRLDLRLDLGGGVILQIARG